MLKTLRQRQKGFTLVEILIVVALIAILAVVALITINPAEAQRRAITSITQGYGGSDDSPGATGPTASGAGMGVGGGYASDYGFLKDGGLATMFTRKR